MKIVLIRHLAPSIAPGICYGRTDLPMDPAETKRIAWIAADAALLGATRVWTSPAVRCRVLAEAIARVLATEVTVDARLLELDFGAWEGRSWDGIARSELDLWAASPLTFAPPGGETGGALIRRVQDFAYALRRGRENCVVVSHGGPLKILGAVLRGTAVDLLAAAPRMGSIETIATIGSIP